MNTALLSCPPREGLRRGRERAIDDPDEPFYGNTPDPRSYACRSAANDGPTHFTGLPVCMCGGGTGCFQKMTLLASFSVSSSACTLSPFRPALCSWIRVSARGQSSRSGKPMTGLLSGPAPFAAQAGHGRGVADATPTTPSAMAPLSVWRFIPAVSRLRPDGGGSWG